MERMYKSRAYSYIETNDAIWFSNIYFNGLEKINKLTGEIELLKKFPQYSIRNSYLHSYVVCVEDYLVFVPNLSAYITSFDMKTNKFVSVALDLQKIGQEKIRFSSACIKGHYVYMFPCRARKIIKYDIYQNTVKYLDVLNAIQEKIPQATEVFLSQYERINEKVYVPFANLNAIMIFDLEQEKADIQYLNIEGGCTTISRCGESFFLMASKKAQIYSWNEKTEEILTYDAFPKDFTENDGSFYYLYCYSYIIGKKIFFFPILGNMIVCFDIVSKQICKVYITKDLYDEKWNSFCSISEKYGMLVMVTDQDYFFHLSYKNETLQFKEVFEQNYSYNKQRICSYLLKNNYFNCVRENDKSKGIKEYIEVVRNSNIIESELKTENHGRKIYNKIQL